MCFREKEKKTTTKGEEEAFLSRNKMWLKFIVICSSQSEERDIAKSGRAAVPQTGLEVRRQKSDLLLHQAANRPSELEVFFAFAAQATLYLTTPSIVDRTQSDGL